MYAPVNPHTKYIHEDLRDSSGKGSEKKRQKLSVAIVELTGPWGAHGTSTFNSPVLMNRLHEREESSGDVGVARPDTPRGGIVWCAWYFDIQ